MHILTFVWATLTVLCEIFMFRFLDMNRTCLILFIYKGSCYYTTKTDQSFIFISWQILITILKTCELTSNLNLNGIFFSVSNQTILHLIWFQFFFSIFFSLLSVSRLMGGSASGSMGHMSNMGSLAGCSVSDTKPMQFPLAQRRKRRVLFTQAQVSTLFHL